MQKALTHIKETLKSKYPEEEIGAFIDIIFSNLFGYSKTDLILNKNRELSDNEFNKIKEITTRLFKDEPIQYIFKEAYFYDLIFDVTPDVLIPRQETEELVHMILSKHKNKPLKILDIGTGSGCIPIALKKFSPSFEVYSCDISKKAIQVAKKNAKRNSVDVNFIHFDILSTKEFPETDFDIVVSNPPYITDKEKVLMNENVLDYEPHLALFVSDDNPLLFYKRITEHCNTILKDRGMLYFEINEAYGPETKNLLEKSGFTAKVINDLNGKERIVKGEK